MVIIRTPLRISFFGGGTDYPVWFEEHGGAVVSTTIDKYSHISCRYFPQFFDHTSRISYSKVELVKSRDEIQHPAVREGLGFVGIDQGIEIHNFDDIPARSGMGSSSSFAVGLLHALRVLKGETPDKLELARNAIHLERNLLKENVGSQDQVAAAFGGLNKITFAPGDRITVEPILLSPELLNRFQDHLMLFFTGLSRHASEIAAEQIKNTPKKADELSRMHAMVDESIGMLKKGDFENFGKLFHEAWQLKRGLTSKITTPEVDGIYEAGREAGALGGKLLGAGGGGFVLFVVPPERRESVKAKLGKFLHIPFKFENNGSRVVFHEKEE